ncbi:hypothetical protein [Aeromonas simiae]|uniref:hypothetical protein n=1 Tax=Aeromonas simiae TaxID=218936 RepID=UPI0005AB08AB|nr:hypothetical protein [Aeromonas simiae]
MDDRQALANEILQTALAECVAPRQDHLPDAAQMVANSFTNEDLEGMAHGDNPVANAYRELLGRRQRDQRLAVLLAELRDHIGHTHPTTMKEYHHGCDLLEMLDAALTQLGGTQCPRCQSWWLDDGSTAEFIGWHGQCGRCEFDGVRTQEDTP